MNIGISKARGKYITRIDSDDTFNPNKLKIQVDILDNNNKYKCVEAYYSRDGKIVPCNCITLMFRSDIIKEIGYFDSVRFGADSEFKFRIYRRWGVKSICRLENVLYYAKVRPNSLTRSEKTGGKEIRKEYTQNFRKWHSSTHKPYMPFPLKKRMFLVDEIMLP